MTPLRSRARRRPDMRRVVILFPSGLTLGNLFFGVFAIIAASRLEFVAAGVYVLLGGICDALDGRVARATNAGSEFGEELDSLVDAITFGLAPGMIMYFAVLNRSGWDWVWVFLFTACAVLRLARFNIEQAGTSKTYFQGLPSPAAGITLASFYWFSQSSLYTYGAIADLKWHVLLRYLMVVLSFLMISNVPYPVFPRTGFRSLRAVGATVLLLGSTVLLLTRRLEYFFPFALIYVAWGLARWVFSGLFERRQPTVPYDLSEGEDEEEEEDEEFEWSDSRVHASRQGHRAERAERTERLERTVRPARGDRPDRSPARSERTPAKVATAEQVVTERSSRAPEAERPPRRDKPKERSKREERPERPARPARPDRQAATATAPTLVTAATPVAPVTPATLPVSGVDAITLGEPESATFSDVVTPVTESSNAGTTQAASAAAEGTGAPRKRKRRRRRGERKDRPSPTEATGGAESFAADEESRDEGDNDSGRDANEGPYRGSEAAPASGAPEPSAPTSPPAPTPNPLPPAAEPFE
jgi:CDP-diacylglycerol---serine O-phosphatidyltransferase